MKYKKAMAPLAIIGAVVIGLIVMVLMIYLGTDQSKKATNPLNDQFNLINDTLNKHKNVSTLQKITNEFSEFTVGEKLCWADTKKTIDRWEIYTNVETDKQTANTWLYFQKNGEEISNQATTDKPWCIINVRPSVNRDVDGKIIVDDVETINNESIIKKSVTILPDFDDAYDNTKRSTIPVIDTRIVVKKNSNLCFIGYILDNQQIFNIEKNEIRTKAYQKLLKEGETCET